MFMRLLAFFVFSFLVFGQGYLKDRFDKKQPCNSNKLKASFFYYPTLPVSGQKIRFFDTSCGNPNYKYWSFGDGHISTEENPIHAYNNPNIYNVSFLVKKGDLISVENRYILIRSTLTTDSQKPRADFIFEPENPQVGVPVKFYDKSTGNPDKRIWQFGYYDFSFLKDPIRIFLSIKRYAISLTVKNQYGTDRCIKYIEIAQPGNNIIIAKSCSLKDVQAAIAQANPGDTVVVPDGKAIWDSQLVIEKGIILKAETKGGVTITSSYAYSTNDLFDTKDYLIVYKPMSPQNDEPFRISGFVFDLQNQIDWLMITTISRLERQPPLTGILTKIRIDSNTIYNYRSRLMLLWGAIYGVMDSNIISGVASPGLIRNFGLNVTAWNNFAFNFGASDNFYFEDNSFTCANSLYFYAEAGARYCARYNTIDATAGSNGLYPFADMHGNQPTSWLATMGAEVYENTIYMGAKGIDLIDVRGGKALAYNNHIISSHPQFYVQIRDEYDDTLNPPPRSPITNQPQHPSETYFWGNRRNGTITNTVNVPQSIYYADEGVYAPTEDIHFFMEKTSFDGSSGVGIGPISQRPIFCSREGVSWWATDEHKLYRWKNGKWELYYVPYTYPHPLRALLAD